MQRRTFLKRVSTASSLMAIGALPAEAFYGAEELTRITIMHTNDMHSRIEPFPMDGTRYEGRGGVARRAAMITNIRKEAEHSLLLDAGDIFQGTPYFNLFGGEVEFKLMSKMGYDAATFGNHDFDGGIDGFERQMPYANFPFVISNYDFSNTILNEKTKEYLIFEKGGVKIGLTGVGIELKGMVPKSLYKETQYLDPIKNANRVSKMLKKELECDYVICLSHLGFKYDEDKVSDHDLAAQSRDIDMIIGGHTHTFLDAPVVVKNKRKKPVIINQAGWAGIVLGRLDLVFERNKKNKCVTCQNQLIG